MGVVYLKEAGTLWHVGIAGSAGEIKWDSQTSVLATDFKDAAEKAQQKAIEERGVVYSLTCMKLRLVNDIPLD